jgi:V8-like Glu-specific endopeptidase
MNPLMGLPRRFHLLKTFPVAMLTLGFGAGCIGQSPSDKDVESITRGIQGGTLLGPDGIGFAVKIDQAMSDGKRLICSGAFITPHVILTAAHCTRNYDYGTTITPTTDTVIRYGKNFATTQKIAGGEKVGWRELGSTDIGLYRVPQAVTLPVIPKLYRSCTTVNLVGGRVVVYGRMIDGQQAPTAEYYFSPERTVKAIANGVGANGNYVQIDPTTDAGDSGGPWVYSQDRIVAVTHTGAYGSRVCDVSADIDAQVKDWGDAVSFVEDSGSSGKDGGSPDQGGSSDAAKSDAGASTTDAGNADGRAGAGGGTAGTTGRAGAGGGTEGSAGRGGTTASGGTTSGGTLTSGAGQTGTSASSVGSGGKATSSGGGGASSGAAGSTGQAGAGAGGRAEGSGGGAQGGAKTGAQAGAAAGSSTGSSSTSGSGSSGCSCRVVESREQAPGAAGVGLFLVFAAVIARGGRRRQ